MPLSLKSEAQIVNDQIAAWAAAVGVTPVFQSGDALLALFQANAVSLDFIQALIQTVSLLTRLATSTGSDVDSFVADYGLTRLPAVAASGSVTLTAAVAPNAPVTIALGTVVQTLGGAIQYTLVADTTQAAYSSAAGAYILPAGQTSITATAQAGVAGAASNVAANALTQFGSGVAGINTVTNASAIASGVNAESDAALRTRFVSYLASLAKATKAAIGYAISSYQLGLTYTIQENISVAGVYTPGMFIVTVDNGTGSPPSSLLTALQAAVDAVRPIGSVFLVQGPTVLTASIAFIVTPATGYSKATLDGAAGAAVTAFVDGLAMGATLSFTGLAAAIWNSAAGIANVTALTINGGTSDIVPTAAQVVRLGSLSAG